MTRNPAEAQRWFDLRAENRDLHAEIERLKAERKNCPPASESEYVRRLEAEIERLQRHIYTLEGLLGEMNIAVPECAALEPKS